MPRRKTFRKRRQKKIQKGGAVIKRNIDGITLILSDFDDDQQTNYYGMIRKTRKNVTMSSQPTEQEPEYEINSYIVSEDQKNEITDSTILKGDEKLQFVDNAFKQFYESKIDNGVDGQYAFFKLGNDVNSTLNNLQIKNVKTDVNWDKSI